MLEWIKEFAMFLVISGLLLEMIAETKYYKFARWVTGVILILQLLRPIADAQNLWEKFSASFASFHYALGSERVLEEIYSAQGEQTQSVLKSYKESIVLQVEKILDRHEISLLDTEIEIAEDGTIQRLIVYGAYRSEKTTENSILIPTVVPIGNITLEEKEKEKPNDSPMEIYLCETLAEFYRIEENKIEVEIKEASE